MEYFERYSQWQKAIPAEKLALLNFYSLIIEYPAYSVETNENIITELNSLHEKLDNSNENLKLNITALFEACSALPPHNCIFLLDSIKNFDEEKYQQEFLSLPKESKDPIDAIFKSMLILENNIRVLDQSNIEHVTNFVNASKLATTSLS